MKKIVYKRDNGTLGVKHVCEGESLTRQSEKDAADINNIVNRYLKSGTWTHVAEGLPWYGDVTDVGDYRSALEAVKRAEESFMSLPAEIRRDFDNDPSLLIDFLKKPENHEKAVKYGLLAPKKQEAPKDDTKPQDPPKA